MAEAQNNKVILHRKEWQTMMPALTITAAGGFVVNDNANLHRFALYVNTVAIHYLYNHEQDDWLPIASGAFGGTFGAGACGTFCDWSLPFIANGGSTSTITVASATYNINGLVVGKTVEFTSGNNIGLRRTITAILNLGGTGTTTLTFDSVVGTAVANNDTFRIASGMFFVLVPGTLSATTFRKYDIATGSWTSCTSTGLAATWGTDGKLLTPGMIGVSYDSGTATSGSATTLNDTGKLWTADQWINYQVRITGGTGIGQIRVITDNTTTQLIFATGATIDNTSVYVIEGDENAIYALGNNAVTMYKYSISANAWATVAPTVARTAAPIAGMSGEFVGVTGDTGWADITNIKDGRYIYSFRGGTSVLDRFDIAGGTAGAGAWVVITYQPSLVTFAAGMGVDWSGKYLYIGKEGTAAIPQRFYAFSVVDNTMLAITSDWYLGGAALLGGRVWVRHLSSAGLVKWLYCLQSTSTTLRRIMIF